MNTKILLLVATAAAFFTIAGNARNNPPALPSTAATETADSAPTAASRPSRDPRANRSHRQLYASLRPEMLSAIHRMVRDIEESDPGKVQALYDQFVTFIIPGLSAKFGAPESAALDLFKEMLRAKRLAGVVR